MKITWVLSDQEKERRFKKSRASSIPPELGLPFSALEEKTIKNLSFLHLPWIKNFFMFDREAAINLIKYVYGEERFRNQPWEIFNKSMSLDFVQHILPTFKELEELSSHDLGQIMHSHNIGIAHFFKMSFWIDIGSSGHVTICPVISMVEELIDNNLL